MPIFLGLAEIYSKLLVGLRSAPIVSYWLLRKICIMLNRMAEVKEAKQNKKS